MARKKPEKLAEKLLKIRTEMGFSQRSLIKEFQLEGDLTQAEISMFESGLRIPNLIVLRKYALLAGLWMDYLIEDKWELPKLPAKMIRRSNEL